MSLTIQTYRGGGVFIDSPDVDHSSIGSIGCVAESMKLDFSSGLVFSKTASWDRMSCDQR